MQQLTEEQVREWLPIVKGRVISLIGNGTPDWEDLTQEVMLSMVRAVKIFREESDVGSLLYVITMRRYYDYLRIKYREKSIACFEQYANAFKNNNGPRRLRGSETRIDKINFYLNGHKLKTETRELLEAVKKTLLSRRLS